MTAMPLPTRAAVRGRERSARRAGARRKFIPLLLVLLGVLLLLYPIVATQVNNVQQRAFANAYGAKVAEASSTTLTTELARARAYNAKLTGVPVLDPYLSKITQTKSAPFEDYQSQLAALGTMARIRVPVAKIDLPVAHGTSDPVLAVGAGHLYGTSLPVGGKSTHAVMTSHTGFSSATLFDHLIDVKQGDQVFVDVYGETLAYQVDQIKVVLPTEIADLKPIAGQDLITLFTCTPYAVNSHRLLVRAHRVPYVAANDHQAEGLAASGLTFEPWMSWLAAGALAGTGVLVVLFVRERRRDKAAAATATATATVTAETEGPASKQ